MTAPEPLRRPVLPELRPGPGWCAVEIAPLAICSRPARLFPEGWRCPQCAPEPPRRPVPPELEPIVPGQCDKGRPRCRKPARLFAGGWCCREHEPGQ